VLYLTVILLLALVAFLPDKTNATAYVLLLVLSLPASLVAAPVLFLVVGLTFADSASIFPRLLVLVLWMALVVGQVVAVGQIRRSRQHGGLPA
jgi:hypothetical protein